MRYSFCGRGLIDKNQIVLRCWSQPICYRFRCSATALEIGEMRIAWPSRCGCTLGLLPKLSEVAFSASSSLPDARAASHMRPGVLSRTLRGLVVQVQAEYHLTAMRTLSGRSVGQQRITISRKQGCYGM